MTIANLGVLLNAIFAVIAGAAFMDCAWGAFDYFVRKRPRLLLIGELALQALRVVSTQKPAERRRALMGNKQFLAVLAWSAVLAAPLYLYLAAVSVVTLLGYL
jgi:hypothetical protein